MKPKFYSLIIAPVFIWSGLVIGISFMEAWLKFQAPGVTLPIGLGIGRIVFAALNSVEWVLAFIIISAVLLNGQTIRSYKYLLLSIPLIILALQTFWLLPSLNERVDAILNHQTLASSNLHIYFVAVEAIKVLLLIISGFIFLTET